jgi:hypothetical protein
MEEAMGMTMLAKCGAPLAYTWPGASLVLSSWAMAMLSTRRGLRRLTNIAIGFSLSAEKCE